MRLKIWLLLCIVMACLGEMRGSCNECCTMRLTAQLVQDIYDAINIIKPKIISIQIDIDTLIEDFSSCCVMLSSKIDNITVDVNISGIDILESKIDECCATLNSKIDNIVITTTVSGLDQIVSCCDTVNSKIGNLSDLGSCLDSVIDVPEDINNLNLTIIQLLKTILLELRGCSC